jgi:farnesyl-diphosphate farnesyltransferase
VLKTIASGMQKDLERFPGEDKGALTALSTRAELVDYTYLVAGCVGEFWSDLHADRMRELKTLERERWRDQGVGLGRALQMTNVLRDVRRDLEHGRCYLPLEDLDACGLEPSDLLDPQSWPRLRPVYEHWARVALTDAKEGLRHTLAIPPRLVSLRLAGLLPLLLAIPTLGLTLNGNPLDPSSRRKISRGTVYATLARAYCGARQNRSLVRLFRETLRKSGLDGL